MKLDEAIAMYIKLRDKKAEIRAEYNSKVEKLDQNMKKIEASVLKAFHASGQTKAGTSAGTVFIKNRVSDKVVDREAFLEFVKENDHFEFIESRISKAALDEYVEETGDLPPGVTRSVEQTINVRRA
jgi:phage host-nuclease inhibitor protein Gam